MNAISSPFDIEAFKYDLTRAVRENQFVLNWQRIASAEGGITLGFEALLRWTDVNRGVVSPAEFIAFAEDHGLIQDIDAWVMNQACMEAARWPQPLRFSVNVCAETFLHRDFPSSVSTKLRLHGVDPRRLEIEVTERVAVADVALFTDHFHRLETLGARIVLDDFGTGYSSLGLLGSFPLHKIKLDRSFVRRLGANERADAVLQAVLKLGTALNLVTCAEGIERDLQLALVQRHGCDEVQGYLIGRPGVLCASDFPVPVGNTSDTMTDEDLFSNCCSRSTTFAEIQN